LGSLLVGSLGTTALSRADIQPEARRDFWLYLDEFHSFTTLSIATMLSELRKYKVGFILAHQHMGQLDEALQAAVFGNVGTILCFRIGASDAEVLAPHFWPELNATDLVRLPNYHMYVRLLVDGKPIEPFSATSFAP